MELSVAERLAVVETKVGALTDSQAEIASDVRVIRDHVISQKANRRFRNQVFAGIGAFVAACGTFWEIFGPFAKKS